MIPDYLIYDELQRQREEKGEWKPERLELPLYVPHSLDEEPEHEENNSDEGSRGVVIIDMNAGEEFD